MREFIRRAYCCGHRDLRPTTKGLATGHTATIYAHRFDAPNDEAPEIIGGNEPDVDETWRFSIEVAKAWESAAEEF